MKKQNLVIIAWMFLLVFACVGCANINKETEQSVDNQGQIRTFADWTDVEIFHKIPALVSRNSQIGEVRETGGGKQTVSINGTELTDYYTYLDSLEEAGFAKYVDNGENGLNNNVYSSTYTKDNLVVTVIHMTKTCITYIVAAEDEPLSNFLFYNEEDVANNTAEAKTTFGMLELWDRGNSFVIQLKNGHFIISDGGHPEDVEYLLTYLEERTPEGQKPIVDAWFVSHPHDDHAQLFSTFAADKELASRICVEGIYFSEYTEEWANNYKVQLHVQGITYASKVFRTTKDESPKIYHPQAGQRYYFNDITVDILQTQEQVPPETFYGYDTNDNENSMWLMLTIEGQKLLTGGDADLSSVKAIMRTYDQEYFCVDIMVSLHHGINVWNEFTDFCTVKTMLYPHYGTLGVFKEGIQNWSGAGQASVPENEYVHTSVAECMSYGDGTKVLTFPYKIGEAQSFPIRGERKPLTGDDLERMIAY